MDVITYSLKLIHVDKKMLKAPVVLPSRSEEDLPVSGGVLDCHTI